MEEGAYLNSGEGRKEVEFDLTFTYEGENRPVLEKVTGEIEKGRCIVLCGSTGCGKSTLLRCMDHLIPDFYEGELKGFCRLQGNDISGLSIGEAGKIAASVFQDPRSQFFTLNSSTEVAFGLENTGMSAKEMIRRVEEAFDTFHMEKLKNRKVFELSSGERQLVAILSAWAMDTDLFLLDEPTANLDYHAIGQLEDLLKILKNEKKTLILSEHRLYYLRDLADEYWFMKDGKIQRKFSEGEMKSLSAGELEELGLRTTLLDRVERKEIKETESRKEPDVFTVKDLRFSYKKNGPDILNGMSIRARTGEVVGLIGANGCGKTTFGKLAAGLLKAQGGKLLFNKETVNDKQISTRCIFIMQEAEFQFFTNSVINEIRYGMEEGRTDDGEIERLLRMTGMWEIRERHPFSLSGGQMQKLVLLLAYFSEKPMVVLDEPTAGLDYKSLKICAQIIEEMRKKKIVFVITHDLELIAESCTRCAVIRDGKVEKETKNFEEVKDYMKNRMTGEERPVPADKKRAGRILDPRTKLFLVLISMIVGVWTDLPLILCTLAGLTLAVLYERHYMIAFAGAGIMAVPVILYEMFPDTIMSFVVSFLPRIILIGVAAAFISRGEEAPRTLAALRKLHVPEKVIMICSVVFRFFPVINADLRMVMQSVKTRGFFETWKDKMKAVPEYLEILIVPMVFRVIRIAELLSASAETRGIDLKGKRESYIQIKFHLSDAVVLVLFTALVVTGLTV